MEIVGGGIDELRIDAELVAIGGARHAALPPSVLTDAWPDVPLKVMLFCQTTFLFV